MGVGTHASGGAFDRRTGGAGERRSGRGGRSSLLRVSLVAFGVWVGGAFAAPGAVLAAPAACPAVMPVSEVKAATAGGATLVGTGLTVSQGTEPETFTVHVLGVWEGIIAPGVDMIVAEADSPALQRAGGIWAGMSGSPVYAPDGRLIGAVAYGMAAGPSKITGLTAAEDMTGVLADGATSLATRAAQHVRLAPGLRRKVAALPQVSDREAAAGLARLPVPVAVSGLRAERLGQLMARLGATQPSVAYRAGAATGAAADPAQIAPGGNFAAALSYGDVTAAGVGTTTMVCDGTALAFGHPFTFRGEVQMSAHTASAITIQDDPTFGPFKLANLTGIAGSIDQDRLVAIRARLGSAPTPTHVTSTVSDTSTGATRDGSTEINDSRDVPALGATHLLANIDRVIDRVGAGSARVNWTATGDAGGQAFALTRENRFADPYDISIASSDELFNDLAALQDNWFAPVTFTGVRIEAELSTQVRQYRIDALERQVAGQWVRVDPSRAIAAVAGRPLVLRVRLSSYHGLLGTRTAQFSLTAPAATPPGEVTLAVRGGATTDEAASAPGSDATSFADLLGALQSTARNDEILAQLQSADDSGTLIASTRRRLSDVVSGQITVPVDIGAPQTTAASR